MPYGYNGKILRINLFTSDVKVEEPGEKFFRKYLGGRGIISYFLLKEIPKGADPLGKENKIIFSTSIATGAPVPGFGRHSIGAKSPLTGFYGESESGGFWGPELKFAGFEAIIVEGNSPKPVYISIKNEKVEIKDAAHLWGKETGDADDLIKQELEDKKVKTLIIGPAGENLVRFSGIAHDLTHYHGRTGMGAVMGSKNLKAVVVRGTNKLEFANSEKLREIARFFAQNFKNNADNHGQHNHGTSDYYFGAQAAGSLPTKNFTTGYFDELDYDADELHAKLKIRNDGCYACPVRCKQVFASEEPYKIDPKYGGPEFETLAAFGSLCGVSDMFAGPKAHELCNRLGLDTVSTGVVISFAMECYEKGIITKEDLDGLELTYGNTEAMLKMVEMISSRKGFGDILAEGAKRAAEKIGKGAQKYAMHVKGQEFAMAEPRAKFGVGLGYAVSPTGADHLQHEHDGAFDPALTGYSHSTDDSNVFLRALYPMGLLDTVPSLSLGGEKVQLFTYLQHYWSLFNSLDICIFVFEPVRTLKVNHLVDIIAAVTGWDTSLFELMKTGERATTLARSFNIKHGLTREDDNLPDRLFSGLEGGVLKGAKMDREEFEKSLTLYYEMMGWDRKNGVPLEGKLFELGIGWVNKKLR
ncbi:MAG: aldehyde ferredoxin oxidoreductase family protein [Spirochaetales bacterium]|nr:aldehyde ferredoxin oxidoreductase family protein [Spirochaetales bacterium]